MDRIASNIQTTDILLLRFGRIRSGLEALSYFVESRLACLVGRLIGVQPQECTSTAQGGLSHRTRSTKRINHQVIRRHLSIASQTPPPLQ